MEIARQLNAAQRNAEQKIRSLDLETNRLEPAQLLRWVDRVLEERTRQIDLIGIRFRKRTRGVLTITFATPPSEVKKISSKLAAGLSEGNDVTDLRRRLVSSFSTIDMAGRISFDSCASHADSSPLQQFELFRKEMAECRRSFQNRRLPPKLLERRCQMIYQKALRLTEAEKAPASFSKELDSFQRFNRLVHRVAAA